MKKKQMISVGYILSVGFFAGGADPNEVGKKMLRNIHDEREKKWWMIHGPVFLQHPFIALYLYIKVSAQRNISLRQKQTMKIVQNDES